MLKSYKLPSIDQDVAEWIQAGSETVHYEIYCINSYSGRIASAVERVYSYHCTYLQEEW
jgi:hypothetical protein